jgi:hypothetical protein
MDRKRTVLGYSEIPTNLKQYGDSFCKQLAEQLIPGKAIVVQYDDFGELKKDQRNIMNNANRRFGAGRARTATDIPTLKLYIWLKPGEDAMLTFAKSLPIAGTFIQTGPERAEVAHE